jgi:hypothetical protein
MHLVSDNTHELLKRVQSVDQALASLSHTCMCFQWHHFSTSSLDQACVLAGNAHVCV